jgi:hypothetical protein
MRVLFFGDTLDKPKMREDAAVTKVWFRDNVMKDLEFEYETTMFITRIQEFDYDILLFDLSQLTHSRMMERQYLTRILLRMCQDRVKTLFVCINDVSYELLKKETIVPMTNYKNLFTYKNVAEIIEWLKRVRNVPPQRR